MTQIPFGREGGDFCCHRHYAMGVHDTLHAALTTARECTNYIFLVRRYYSLNAGKLVIPLNYKPKHW